MFCDEDDDIPTMFRRGFGRSFESKSTEGGICCVESSRASKMTSRDLGGFNSECTMFSFDIYPTLQSLAQASS